MATHPGSGIGRACDLSFVKEGAAGVMIADINLDAAQAVAKEVQEQQQRQQTQSKAGCCTEAVHLDVTNESSVEQATARMVELFGRIDYCVHCAGVSCSRLRFPL
jgi:NAD(P)-dependent dehydrogenase (short-subunit alcohol dehydrogenase family)